MNVKVDPLYIEDYHWLKSKSCSNKAKIILSKRKHVAKVRQAGKIEIIKSSFE